MKRAKREESSKSMDRISELPKDMLRRILYFLSQTDAVRTSVLSRSWRYIWCTRPNVDFGFSDNNCFRGKRREFVYVVDKTLQQYCDQRVRLEEFGLHINLSPDPDHNHGSVSLLQKWIPLLTSMGVKDFRLSSSGVYSGARVDLPSVVFGSESLKHLDVEYFNLDQEGIGRMVLCKHLKSLSLDEVCVDVNTLQTIIASCPLIETLSVGTLRCKGQKTIKMNHLKDFCLTQVRYDEAALLEELCSIEIYPPSLETISICDGNIWFHNGANFLNLNVFHLSGMGSSLDHFSSSKFPNLEWLTLNGCDGLKEIELFIDAPNILSFEYHGSFVPSISFATTSNEWKSEICLRELEGSLCFLKLYELLKSLSQSEISLEIGHDGSIQENIMLQDNDYTKPVVVESLCLCCPSSSFPSILNAVICICRPRSFGGTTVGMMWKILMERESGNKQLLFRDLEEASLEIKETVVRNDEQGWHPAPLSEFLLNDEGCLCRFALKWRETL